MLAEQDYVQTVAEPALPPTNCLNSQHCLAGGVLKGKKWSSVFGQRSVLAFPPAVSVRTTLAAMALCSGAAALLLGSVRTFPHPPYTNTF